MDELYFQRCNSYGVFDVMSSEVLPFQFESMS